MLPCKNLTTGREPIPENTNAFKDENFPYEATTKWLVELWKLVSNSVVSRDMFKLLGFIFLLSSLKIIGKRL